MAARKSNKSKYEYDSEYLSDTNTSTWSLRVDSVADVS